eukprot:scaffold66901_cov50-Phaeocystis_antarctica.AAC.2
MASPGGRISPMHWPSADQSRTEWSAEPHAAAPLAQLPLGHGAAALGGVRLDVGGSVPQLDALVGVKGEG